jgi:biopolymer transport protein ExbD
MAGGGGGGESGEPEFQIAPMVDVLLVLLIFFMCITSAEVLKVDKHIKLPVSPNAKKRDPEMSKHEIAINIRWSFEEKKATLVVDEKVYPVITELIPYLKDKLAADKQLRAVVRGDAELPAVEIQRIMDIVAQGGLADISFAASNK